MAKRNAQGAGTIRKKTVTRNDKDYTYWEARITIGRNPVTGKQMQQSFSGKTQKEVREKMQAAAVAVNDGTYTPPSKMTVGQWLDIWASEYLGNLKPGTAAMYKSRLQTHVIPSLGGIKLSSLTPHAVQAFINGLEGQSTGSIQQIYRVFSIAMNKAVQLDYIPKNPATHCVIPKRVQKDIQPLDDAQTAAVLEAAKGTYAQHLITVALFSGMRISELLGLTWDCIDTEKGTITINKQLARPAFRKDSVFISPKNGKTRIIAPAPSVFVALNEQRLKQMETRLKAGQNWNNENNLVFTAEDGTPFNQYRAENAFRSIQKRAGLEGVRFHDLRHTYAVNAIRAGDDIKSIQGNLGHSTAAFTLDKYGHFTERMKQDSAQRMEDFIKSTLNL